MLGYSTSKILKALKWTIILSVILVFVYMMIYPSRILSKIHMGMTKEQVISIIGDKRFSDTKNLEYLCVKNSWGGCKSTLESGSTSYVIWNFGIDTVLVVGFNEKSEVIFSTFGDT